MKKIFIIIIAIVFLSYLLTYIGEKMNLYDINLNAIYMPPSKTFPLGTDELGRNFLARLIYAIGLSLRGALVAILVSLVVAYILGTTAGFFYKKLPDKIITFFITLLLTTPPILFIVSILSIFNEPSIFQIYFVIGMFIWPQPARLVRAEIIQLKNSTLLLSMKALGFKTLKIYKDFFSLTIYPAFVSIIYSLPEIITIDAALAFFGIGPQPPTPTLGKIILNSILTLNSAPWHIISSLLVIILLITSIYFSAKDINKKSLFQVN